MKEQDLKTLKELAKEIMREYPAGLLLDGEGNFHEENIVNGIESGMVIVEPHVVIRRLHYTGDIVRQLCDAVLAIEGRKKPGE